MNARNAYSSAISAGCVCDVNHNFFSTYDELKTLPRIDDNSEQSDNLTYCVCVPVIAPPKNKNFDGTVETVTRKKSLVMKFADTTSGNYYKILQDEAKRRGLTLSGRAWVITGTGPHRKTASRTYTFIIGAEIL